MNTQELFTEIFRMFDPMGSGIFAKIDLENGRREAESTEKWAAGIRTSDPTMNEHQGYYPAKLDMKLCSRCGDWVGKVYKHIDKMYCQDCLNDILEENNLVKYELKTA